MSDILAPVHDLPERLGFEPTVVAKLSLALRNAEETLKEFRV